MKTVIDVSSVIYAGHNGADRRVRGFPVGGIRKLLGIINAGLSQSDFVLCFDGGELIKKELLPTYKAGRVPDYSVLAQIDLLKEILTSCGIPYFCDPEHEADDYIYSVCDEFMKLGDEESIVIYTDDRDISCCVTDQISIRNVSSNGICITRQNYQDRVVRGRTIPYNSILLWKIFHGDASDNYKALHITGLTFESFSHTFLTMLEPLINPEGLNPLAYANYEVFEIIANEFINVISSEDMTRLKDQARIAFPYRVEVSDCSFEDYVKEARQGCQLYALERNHMKLFGTGSFDRRKFDFYCSLLDLNKTRPNRSVDRDSAEAQEFYKLLELRAKELSSGVMAVTRYRSKRTVDSSPVTIQNMELPV